MCPSQLFNAIASFRVEIMARALRIMLCANIRFDHFDERNFSIGMQNPMKIVDSLWLWCLL